MDKELTINFAHISIWRYLCHFTRPYLWHIIGAVGLLIINASIILGLGYTIRRLTDADSILQNLQFLNLSYLLSIIAAFVFALTAFARTLLTGWLGEKIVADIKTHLFTHLLSFDQDLLSHYKLAEFSEYFSSDTQHILTCLSNSLAVVIRSLLQVTGATILLWVTSPKLTLLTFLIVPIVIFPIRIIGKYIRCQSDKVHTIQTSIQCFIREHLDGLIDIQLFQNEFYVLKKFKTLIPIFLSRVSKRLVSRSLLIALVIFMLFAAVATVIWIGSHDVIAGKMTAGSLISFVFYAIVTGGSLNQMAELISESQTAYAAFARIVRILQVQPMSVELTPPPTEISIPQLIQIDDISFCYPTCPDRHALNQISLNIKQGQQIAIVGPSGAGKSTLFQLLTSLYQPNSGQILIDGIDLSSIKLSRARRLFSIVPQNPVLFNATIYDNIHFGDSTAARDRVMQAAQQAGVMEFVDQLPQGIDTILGDQGHGLSNGQKQRVAIARALLRSAPILLMDEATNALDAISERLIQDILEQIKGIKTVLIIAHRLSTVINAQHIVVMNQGQIVQQGIHTDLVQYPGLYRTLAENQFFALT